MSYLVENSLNNIIAVNSTGGIAQDSVEVFRNLFIRDLSLNSKKALASDLKSFISWYITVNDENFSFLRLTARDVIDYRNYCKNELEQKPSTTNRKILSIRSLCKEAMRVGLLQNNPCNGIKWQKLQVLAPKGLDPQESRRLLKEVDLHGNLRDKLIVYMLRYGGFRISELLKMKCEDIHLTERKGHVIVRNGKGNKTRLVPLAKQVRDLLAEYIAGRDPSETLFNGQRGELKCTMSFNKILKVYADKARVHCSPHQLRHTFAYSYLKSNPGDIIGLGALLGHSNVNTTAIYTQHRLEDLQERVERM